MLKQVIVVEGKSDIQRIALRQRVSHSVKVLLI